MNDARSLWDRVGSGIADVGFTLKHQFDQAGAGGASAVQDSLRDLGAVIEDSLTGLTSIARDPAVREDLAKAAQSLGGSLATNLGGLGQELAGLIKARAGGLGGR